MYPYISLFKFSIPTYGLLILIGFLIANLLAYFFSKKTQQSFDNFLLLEAYIFLGGFLGAKLLYLFIARKEIDWSKFFYPAYFNAIMKGGFVFYGGLIGGLISCFICGKIHKIKIKKMINDYCFLIPLVHSFGRLGCFFAGCCYGKEYDGLFSVSYPQNSFAPSGISLFPVQLLESFILLIIFFILLCLILKQKNNHSLSIYLVLYSITRFCLEIFRADDERGIFWILSTSQWISFFILIFEFFYWSYFLKIKKIAK